MNDKCNMTEVKSDLKRSQSQVKKDFIIFSDGFTERHKNHIVDPKQRDQQQSGFGQPSVGGAQLKHKPNDTIIWYKTKDKTIKLN